MDKIYYYKKVCGGCDELVDCIILNICLVFVLNYKV